jgi:hypothetical protein
MLIIGSIPGVTDPAWLAWMCENLTVLRMVDPTRTRQLLDYVRAGQDVAAALDAFSRELDLPDPRENHRDSDPVPGARAPVPGLPSREVLVCPTDRCGRVAVHSSGVPPRMCHIDGARLRLVRV